MFTLELEEGKRKLKVSIFASGMLRPYKCKSRRFSDEVKTNHERGGEEVSHCVVILNRQANLFWQKSVLSHHTGAQISLSTDPQQELVKCRC